MVGRFFVLHALDLQGAGLEGVINELSDETECVLDLVLVFLF